MANRSQFDQLEQAIQSLTSPAANSRPTTDPGIAPLVELAAELRDLPRPSFRARLKSELLQAIAKTEGRGSMTTATVNPIREGFHTITPYMLSGDAGRLIQFMQQAFSAEEILRVKRPDGSIMHSQFRIGDSMIEAADARGEFPARATAIHMYVPDADVVYRRALEAGGTSLHEMTDQPYGDREGSVRDPLGNHWYIATHRATGLAPEGLRTITPYLHCKGAGEVLAFIERALGGNVLERAQAPDGLIQHAKMLIGDSVLELGEAHGKYQPMGAALHLYVEDTDALYQQVMAAGATSIYPPSNQDYGDRSAALADPFGNHWYLATAKR